MRKIALNLLVLTCLVLSACGGGGDELKTYEITLVSGEVMTVQHAMCISSGSGEGFKVVCVEPDAVYSAILFKSE